MGSYPYLSRVMGRQGRLTGTYSNMHSIKMESIAPRAMAPAAMFYYGPDAGQENRQHAHAHYNPHLVLQQMPMYPIVPTVPSTPIYSRPSSSSSQPPVHSKVYQARIAAALTPCASPQPMHRPAIMLETEFRDGDYFPSTPPLSSSASSPGSCDMLQTPCNPMFSGLDGFEGEQRIKVEQLDSFPNVDWSKCGSPPLTPGKLIAVSLSNTFPISPKSSTPNTSRRTLPGTATVSKR